LAQRKKEELGGDEKRDHLTERSRALTSGGGKNDPRSIKSRQKLRRKNPKGKKTKVWLEVGVRNVRMYMMGKAI